MPFAKICDIQFECPMKFPLQPACVSFSPDNVTVPDDAELAAFFKDLHEVNPKAAILSIVPGYCDSFNPTSQSSLLPPLISSYYKPESLSHALSDLILESQILFSILVVTNEQAKCLEEKTREQSKSKLWHRYRAGRITASKFKQAAICDPLNPSISLVKSICYPEIMKFTSSAIRYLPKHNAS